jgi:GT2 family glycosyltransferase
MMSIGWVMLENLIVPVLNRYDLLQRMLSSLDYPIGHLLIVDNGASAVEHSFELDVPDCVEHTTYLPMPANLGVAGSWNLGIKSFPYADRWFFVSNDVQFHPGGLETLSDADRGEITLSSMFPYWQAFCLGYEAVRAVGLFDEGFFPAYFEDTDYIRRALGKNVPIVKLDVAMEHDNSSTIRSDARLKNENARTFALNNTYHAEKIRNLDDSAGSWDVYRRRMNGWEADR